MATAVVTLGNEFKFVPPVPVTNPVLFIDGMHSAESDETVKRPSAKKSGGFPVGLGLHFLRANA